MRLLTPLIVCLFLRALQGAEDPLAVARQFTAQLTLEQTGDEKLFAAAGKDRAQTLLLAVMRKGQGNEATAADWTGLHRAVSGLIELYIWSGDPFRASIYSGEQQRYYGSLEHDYTAGLEFAQRAYDLHENSGQPLSQFLNLKAIGENLLHLARPREALDAFHRAQQCMDDRYSITAAITWRRILQADVAARDFPAAEADLQLFQDAARSAPPLFQAHSILGGAEIRMEQGRFPAALDGLKQARALMQNGPEAATFSYEITADLLSCLLDAMFMLPYDEALATAHRMESDFPGLPIPIVPFAAGVIRMRRRMAGDVDG